MTNISIKTTKEAPRKPSLRSLVHIEPYRLWTIKVLKKFNILTKEELANLLEQYLESINKIKANINKNSEKESDDYLVTLDPVKWKDQDHYFVLGLQGLRYQATDDDIRRAHRRKALKHHPDKRSKTDKNVDPENDYYSCITRAFEILGDPVKRLSFDSVDPTFDDTIPKTKVPSEKFFETFGPVFERNARWSVKKHVPYLGVDSSPRQQVERFYEFWYDFPSWREFSYLDEEDKEKGENRDERRWLDRQNKTARQQRKRTENQRIRQLVDNAYSCDPRIAKFKEEDKKKKLDIKKAKQDEIRARIEREEAERLRLEEEEKMRKSTLEEEEKKKRLEEKKQKEQTKKDTKRAVKNLEEIFKANEYFITNSRDKVKHIEKLDVLIRMMSLLEIVEFKNSIESYKDFEGKQKIFLSKISEIDEKLDQEKKKQEEIVTNNKNNSMKTLTNPWTEDEIKLLVKSVSVFPAGTKDRWEVISNYMAQHSSNQTKRDSKQILAKVKQIQEQLAKRRA